MKLEMTIHQDELIKQLLKSNKGLSLQDARRFVLRNCDINNNKLITLYMTFEKEA